MRRLDKEQRSRLVEILNENLENSSVRDIAKKVGYSFGAISGIASESRKRVPEAQALMICKGLGVNPYYILENREPKYVKWEEAFNGTRKYD